MKLKHNLIIIILLLLASRIYSQNTAPVVSNIDHSYNSETGVITITYDVNDSEENIVSILIEVSDDGGQTTRINARWALLQVRPERRKRRPARRRIDVQP